MVGSPRPGSEGEREAESGEAHLAPTGALQQRDTAPETGLPPGAFRPVQIPTCRKRCLGAYRVAEVRPG
eukprot:8384348-Lingulodinium_polyedra.AAC.1